MTLSDYILDLALIGLVLFQIRGRKISVATVLLPLVVVAVVASQYLKSIPTSGNDLLLIVGCATVGALLGGVCALYTTVRPNENGVFISKAGAVAALAWVAGCGLRFAFQFYATHGGGAAIGRFSIEHHITAATAWTAALLLMAIAEALTRSLGVAARWYLAQGRSGQPALQTATAADGQYGWSEHVG
ncbi:MAG TPA: hypothetical protein VME46_24645 [Acidimicrobiales bacterium]|nr:hypothetical protein [Acidimicrobiales bacterium]